MAKVEDWLEGIPSSQTRKSNKNGLRKFEEYYGKGMETSIGSEKAGKTVEKFFVWMKACALLTSGLFEHCFYAVAHMNLALSPGIPPTPTARAYETT